MQDTVSGFVAALSSTLGVGEVVNIGSNFEISIGNTVQIIAEIMSASVDIITDEIRLRPSQSEVERLWADNTKAKRLFDWQPLYGGQDGFRRGLQETVNWFLQTSNRNAYKSDLYNI